MAILSAMQTAALRLIGHRPSSFFGSTYQEAQEIADLANEVAEDIAQYQDWQAITRIASIAANGTDSEFDLPEDYGRMLKSASVVDSANWFWGYYRFEDVNELMYASSSGFGGVPGGWMILQNKLIVAPAPPAGRNASFPYISSEWAMTQGGQRNQQFGNDNDRFLVLPEKDGERLLALGIVWRWRSNKGLFSEGDESAFIKALDEYAAKDGGAKIIRRNSRIVFGRARLAFPGILGPATY